MLLKGWMSQYPSYGSLTVLLRQLFAILGCESSLTSLDLDVENSTGVSLMDFRTIYEATYISIQFQSASASINANARPPSEQI